MVLWPVRNLRIFSKNGKELIKLDTIKKFIKHLDRRSNIEENNSKLLAKLAKQAGSCCVHGTFAPVWQVLKTSAERLSLLHIQMVQKVTDLVKEVSKYADELHKKHKQVSSRIGLI